MTTGKVATSELSVAINPMEATVPKSRVVAPVGVMVAWSPWAISPISVSSTVVLTM